MDISDKELLNFAIENGIIDANTIRKQIEMNERKKFIEKHEHEIWQGKNGLWYTYLPGGTKGRRLVKRKTKELIEDEMVKFYKSIENEPTIKQIFEMWADEKLRYGEIQKQSYDRYKTDFDRFFVNNEFFKHFSDRKIKYLSEDDLEEFIKISIAKMNLTQKAYSGLRTIVNGIFKYAKKKKYADISITNFMGDLDLSRRSFKKNIKDKENEVYQEAEIEKLTSYLRSNQEDIRCQGLLLIFESGVRIGELCGLKPEDIHDGYIHIQRTEVKYRDESDRWVMDVRDYPKSEAGDRYIIINENAVKTIENIESIRENGEYLFMENGKRIRSNGFRRKLERVCNTLGIKYKSNHKIRKTYGTMLIDSGVDESIVAEQMGHADISTTKKYYYFSNKSEEKKREQISRAVYV